MTTVNSHPGEEIDQLQEIIQQKSQIIEMLSKEKNYYMKKIEQVQQQFNSLNQSKSGHEDLELKYDQAKSTVQTQKELIQKQQDYIQELEDKQKHSQKEVDDLLNQINALESQNFNQKKQELSSVQNTSYSVGGHDDKRSWTAQCKLVEDLVKENFKLKEDQRYFSANSPLQNFDAVSSRLEKLINELFIKVVNQPPKQLTLEDQIFEIKTMIEMKKPLFFPKTDLAEQALTEQRFSKVINLNYVQTLYEDFFSPLTNFSKEEVQTRCFKDLYNVIEESASKFHEIFIQYQSLSIKNQKFNETFQQLDRVFSQEGQTEEDSRVLDELRKLGNMYLQQVFDLQEENTLLRSLESMPDELVKLLKQSYTKKLGKGSVGNARSLEEQMINMNEKLREQDALLRQKERKLVKNKSKTNTTIRTVKSVERQLAHSNSQQELICNLNKALDQIYNLEQVNDTLEKEKTVISLELRKAREEVEKIQKDKKDYDKYKKDSEEQLKEYLNQIKGLQDKLEQISQKFMDMEKESKEKSEKIQKISGLNEELRDLIQQERQAYSEDQKKSEDEYESLKKQHETKLKLIRSKLLMLMANDGLEKDYQGVGIDDILKKFQDHHFHNKKHSHATAYASSQLGYSQSITIRDENRPNQKAYGTTGYLNFTNPPSIRDGNSAAKMNSQNITQFQAVKFEDSQDTIGDMFRQHDLNQQRAYQVHADNTPSKYSKINYSNNKDGSKKQHYQLKGHSSEKKILETSYSKANTSVNQPYTQVPKSTNERKSVQPPNLQLHNYQSQTGFKDLKQSIPSIAQTIQQREPVEFENSSAIQPSESHGDNKKQINDILSNFKKEKEMFSEKLVQLRIKLQGSKQNEVIQSPDQLGYQETYQDLQQMQTQDNHTNNFMSPIIDSRRAKTLQKLKNHFGQNLKNEEQIKMRPFDLQGFK